MRGISGLYDVTFMPDGKRLVTAGQDGTARVWDVASGQQLLTLAGNTSTVTSVSASPDGKRIASSGYDGTLKIWDAAPGRELLTLTATFRYRLGYCLQPRWKITGNRQRGRDGETLGCRHRSGHDGILPAGWLDQSCF